MIRLAAGLLLLAVATPVLGQPQQWGDIKGQVVWVGKAIPERDVLDVTKDKDHCLSKGKLLSEDLVIDKATKGVRWVMVWLVDAEPKKALPVHPMLKGFAEKVTFDQPCCMFEPYVMGVRAGQTVVVKNSAPILHNVNIISAKGPNLNETIQPGKSLDVQGWQASASPSSVSCTIHPWMKMWVRTFDHPYFVVTDEKGNFEIKNAPAGDYRIVAWTSSQGYLLGKKDKTGEAITILAGKTVDFPVKMSPEK